MRKYANARGEVAPQPSGTNPRIARAHSERLVFRASANTGTGLRIRRIRTRPRPAGVSLEHGRMANDCSTPLRKELP